MPDQTTFITVFRSADNSAEVDATEAAERLAQAGIDSILLGDDEPGVVEGTWEVRVAPADRERAETILAAAPPEKEDEVEVSEAGQSHDLDFVSIFSDQGAAAEMEALSIKSLLEANDIPCVMVGSAQIPSLPFEVRVPKWRLEEARTLLAEARKSGAATGDGGDGA